MNEILVISWLFSVTKLNGKGKLTPESHFREENVPRLKP